MTEPTPLRAIPLKWAGAKNAWVVWQPKGDRLYGFFESEASAQAWIDRAQVRELVSAIQSERTARPIKNPCKWMKRTDAAIEAVTLTMRTDN